VKYYFVTEILSERVVKLCLALKIKGLEYVCIHLFNKKSQDFKELNLNIIKLNSHSEILTFLKEDKPKLIHLYSFGFDATCLELIKNINCKLVYEPKDVFKGVMNLNIPQEVQEGQIALLEHSDGIVHRDFQPHLCAKENKFCLSRNRLYLPDLCWPEILKFQRKISFRENKDKIKLVFAGNFYLEKHNAEYATAGIIHILREVISQDFEVHLYPFLHNDLEFTDAFSEYKQLESNNEHFTIHKALEPINLVDEYQKYDFGCHLFQGEHFHGLPRPYEHKEFGKYGNSARIFDFIAAGIPLINSSSFKLINRLLYNRRCNIIVKGEELKTLYKTLKDIDYCALKLSTIHAYYKLRIDKRIDKLLAFYNRVIA
jgi:hypothetical protein